MAENYRVELMVTHGSNNSPYEAAEEANAFGADLFVSIHNNAGGGDGYEALVGSEAQVALGKLFESHVKAIGQNSRGVKLRPGLIVLRNTKMPAVLNEGAFVDNQKDIADWNAGKIAIGLLHPASGGHGLNLQEGGSTIVWYGMTWSLELYQQLNARLWRQGQKETVVVHHLVVKGTMDEQVMKALHDKAADQNALLAAVKARIQEVT